MTGRTLVASLAVATAACGRIGFDVDGADAAPICTDAGCIAAPTLVLVDSAGRTFTMGSPFSEQGRGADELQHSVTFTRSFKIGPTEVTQSEFEALLGFNPSLVTVPADRASRPVEDVTWYEAIAYLIELTRRAGGVPCYEMTNIVCVDATNAGTDYMRCMNSTSGGIMSATVALAGVGSVYDCTGFRLPTEAEWEFAARAGDMRATYNGELDSAQVACEEPNSVLDSISWFCGNSNLSPQVVATKAPNGVGLYDMLGNAWEWCWDWYGNYSMGAVTDPVGAASGAGRVNRGGVANHDAGFCRAADRGNIAPGMRVNFVGFRIAKTN